MLSWLVECTNIDSGPSFKQNITLAESSDEVKGKRDGLNWLKITHKEIQALTSDFTLQQQTNQRAKDSKIVY